MDERSPLKIHRQIKRLLLERDLFTSPKETRKEAVLFTGLTFYTSEEKCTDSPPARYKRIMNNLETERIPKI